MSSCGVQSPGAAAAFAPRPEITEALATELGARVLAHGGSPEMLAVMRLEHPGVRFVVCNEDDVSPRLSPWLSLTGIQVFLLDASEHCVSITTVPERACGLLFALISDDD